MRHIRVHMANPGDTYDTTINGTEGEIRGYFEGQTLNLGAVEDRLVRCLKVEFIHPPDPNEDPAAQ